jgi:hypothetical protein
MKHRPIKKVEKSPNVFILGIIINLIILVVFYGFLNEFTGNTLQTAFVSLSLIFLVISITTFLLTAFLKPGYLEK